MAPIEVTERKEFFNYDNIVKVLLSRGNLRTFQQHRITLSRAHWKAIGPGMGAGELIGMLVNGWILLCI
jgi:hypothetical protein